MWHWNDSSVAETQEKTQLEDRLLNTIGSILHAGKVHPCGKFLLPDWSKTKRNFSFFRASSRSQSVPEIYTGKKSIKMKP